MSSSNRYLSKIIQIVTNRRRVKFVPVLNEEEWNNLKRKVAIKYKDLEAAKYNKEIIQMVKNLDSVRSQYSASQRNSSQNDKSKQTASYSLANYWPLSLPTIEKIPAIWGSSKDKTANNSNQKDIKPDSNQKPVTSIPTNKPSVDTRWNTAKLLHTLETITTSDLYYIKRLENLCNHLKQYPETRGQIIRQNGIGHILRIKEKSKEIQETQLQANEVLALLGYHSPPKSNGIRILAIDGGGMRGIIALEMLKLIEKETGQPIHELFDFVCGVSTGAIIASFLSFHKKTIPEVEKTYKEIGSKIFTQHWFEGSRGLVTSHSYYNTKLYEEILQEFVGSFPMNDIARNLQPYPKVAIVSSQVCDKRITPYVFRSYDLPFRNYSSYNGSSKHPIWTAVRASSAAPTYFDDFLFDNKCFSDGGILANNATHIGIHEAKRLWPSEKLQCVVSLGLGRNETSFDSKEKPAQALSSLQKLNRIIDSATDTELIHETLNDNLESDVYYRFNPYMPEFFSLDEKRPEKMNLMTEVTKMYMRRNRSKVLAACKQLKQPRSLPNQAIDYFNCQKLMYHSIMDSRNG